MIFNNYVSGQRYTVGKDVVVADFTVVSDVDADHEEVARADASKVAFSIGAVQGAELSNQVVVADVKKARLTFEFDVLGLTADHGVFKDSITGTQPSEAFDNCVGTNLTIVTNLDILLDYGKRPNANVGSQGDGRMNHRSFVDLHKNWGC